MAAIEEREKGNEGDMCGENEVRPRGYLTPVGDEGAAAHLRRRGFRHDMQGHARCCVEATLRCMPWGTAGSW
jgi:hypothetical protein